MKFWVENGLMDAKCPVLTHAWSMQVIKNGKLRCIVQRGGWQARDIDLVLDYTPWALGLDSIISSAMS